MRRALWTLIAAAGLAFAQDQPKIVTKIIDVKYGDPERIMRLVGGSVNVRSDSSLHAMVLSGNADAVAAVEAMIRKLDVAPANIELTVYLISGNVRDTTDDLPKD